MILQTKEHLEDLVVKSLAEKPNLSAADIHQRTAGLKKYTLQAVYKELRKLQNGGVVVKLKKRYSLRLPWVLDFASLADTASATYINAPSLTSILPASNKKEIWHFNNLLKMNDFWSHILLMLIQQSVNKTLLGWNPHPWFHLVQTKQEEQYIKSLGLAKGKLYLIIGGNTFLDRWAEKFLNQKIVEYSFAKSIFDKNRSTYLNVIDDYVLTVKLDRQTTQVIESLYSKTMSASDLNFASVFKIFQSQVKASIWLEKNLKKSKIIRGRFTRFFGVKF